MSGRWIDVAGSDAVSETTPLGVEFDGQVVVIVRCGATLYAVEDRCTHDGESLAGAEVDDCQLICPRHGARFCLRAGAYLRGARRERPRAAGGTSMRRGT